jgi:hypothetical protein
LFQESVFNREYSKELENTSDQFEYLKKSSITAQKALSLVDKKPQNRQFRSFLFTELASTYGSMAMTAESENDKISYVHQAFENCLIAYHINPQNIHPIITLFWISGKILDNNKFSDENIRYVEQTVFHTCNLSETESYEFCKQEKILSKQMELLEKMGKRELSNEIFEGLLKDRSSNGIYIRASNQVSFIYLTPELSKDQRQICSETYHYLIEYEDKINIDGRYLFLMFKTWWGWKTGHRLFHKERMVLPFTANDWSECRKMITRILSADEFTENMNLQYLEGICCFHLNDFNNGFEIFKNLDRESISFARRIYKYFLWSDPNGNPRIFNGTVVWINEKGKGEMHIHEIQKHIGFIVHDTGRADLQKGDALSNFHIAFNMRGPIADFRS